MRTAFRLLTMLLLAAASLAAAAREPGSKVGVTFDKTSIDFGNVAESGRPVHMEYTMYNTSGQAVSILSANASCGCTRPEARTQPLPPGDSTVIKVNFITTGQRGEVSKEVTLRLMRADGKKEKVNLVFRGVVVPETR